MRSGPLTTPWNRWNSATREQRARVNNTLIDLWESAEKEGDEELGEIVKEMLVALRLPFVRMGPRLLGGEVLDA